MIETRKAHELDIVELTEDLPEYGVRRGERGTVVEVFDEPEEAYMIEFVDASGTESRLADWVRPTQIVNPSLTAKEAFERGILLFGEGKLGEAEKNFKLAIDLNPQYKAELRSVVQANFGNTGNWKAAIPPLRLLLRIDPNDVDTKDSLGIAWLNFGVQEAKAGRAIGATTMFMRAAAAAVSSDVLSLSMDNLAIAYRNLGIQAHQAGNLKDTRFYMNCAFMASPNESTRRNLGIANAYLASSYMKGYDFRHAIFFFEAAEESGLVSAELLNNYGVALVYEERLDEASRVFERALELKPGNNIILGNISNLRQLQDASDFMTEEITTGFIPAPPLREYSIAA